jgi:hypothetical protein
MVLSHVLHAQSDSSLQLNGLSEHSLQGLEKKYNSLGKLLQKQSEQFLKRMQRKEARLQKKLEGKDSIAAKQMLAQSQQKYQELASRLHSKSLLAAQNPLKEYIPGLDSLQTGMRFLEQAKGKIPGLSADKLEQVQAVNQQLKNVQLQLQKANDIKSFVKEHGEQLKDQLGKYNLGTGSINKEVYYYQQRLQGYKDLINNREKLKEKVLSALRETPAFKRFMQQNSYLSQLFPAAGVGSTGANLTGLQTRSQVQQMINQRLGAGAVSGNTNGGNPMQSQLQAAQEQMGPLKDKINNLGGGNSDLVMPEGFKPNSQKTKSFFQRLEYGFNVQSQGSSNFLPSISDLALTAGYKINDKSTLGIGASYKLGWGRPFNDVRISSEGVGLRSFIDIKAKGSIWITGGYELNYLQAFSKLDDLNKPEVWQRSGLLGLTKKYKVGKKQGNMQLLWDFLSYSQVPKAAAIKFRIGYAF